MRHFIVMAMHLVKKAEFAKMAGVTKAAVAYQLQPGNALNDALVDKKIDIEHESARAYLNKHGAPDIAAVVIDESKKAEEKVKEKVRTVIDRSYTWDDLSDLFDRLNDVFLDLLRDGASKVALDIARNTVGVEHLALIESKIIQSHNHAIERLKGELREFVERQ